MSGYIGINLKEIIEQIGEVETKSILSDFSCPLNPDIENFLKNSAIEFSKQGISSTYLVMTPYQKKYVLVGYYTLANKFFCIDKEAFPSKRLCSRISKFAQYDSTLKRYTLSAPLICQLGKNFTNSYNNLITGDELLKLALDKVKDVHTIIGGKIVYLECENKQKLTSFYSDNGFVSFGKRYLDHDEADVSGNHLIQMLKYMK